MAKIQKSTKKFKKKRFQKILEQRRNIKKIKNKNKYSKKNVQKIQEKNKTEESFSEENTNSFLDETLDAFPTPITSEDENDNSFLDENKDHKKQLDALKNEDSEFYKYLQEEEAELLNFEDSDISDDIKTNDSFENTNLNNKELTLSIVHEWKKAIVKEGSLKILKKAVIVLHKAASFNEASNSLEKPLINNSDVFNALVTLVFKQVPRILHERFSVKDFAKGHFQNEKKAKKVLFIIKTQFSNILYLLHDLTDPDILHMMLEETEKLIPYATTYRKFMKHLIKLLIHLWSTQTQDYVRNTAYLVIKKILLLGDRNYIEHALKGIYTSFNQQSSCTNAITLPFICSMKDMALELFEIDQEISYQVSFKCIRQLAIQLRNAIIKHDKESFKIIYNWKYVHSINFWSCILSNSCDKTKKGTHSLMQDLIYPLVQVALGTIKSVSSSQFFPLKFHLIRSLIHISYCTGIYIPLAPYIFEILESKEIKNKPASSTAKPIDFELCIRVPKSYLKGKIYQNGLIEQIIELLLEFYSLQCKSISFPELAMPMIIQIKRYIKQSKNSKLNKSLIIFIEKLKENSEFIESQRKFIEFSLEKIDEMETFLEDYDWDMTPLGKYVNFQRRIKEERKKIETNQQE
ncbi:hypothetical protein PORY_001016 [Pneumocystis oryctolagi]|uniref:Uncharacterized protein n=1 Tax=Pneumocystis oryctolagi TaxID=42067 RepID=A0ACB7CDJ0_9ASCO|nr:hypothetical protein PORY_001016 [Pneumocystis oryctolagi]